MQILSFKTEPKLGEGIFTIRDASIILNLSPSLVRRWIQTYWENKFLNDNVIKDSNYVWGEKREKGFNFCVLVEIIAVHSFKQIGVSFNKIKLAHTQLIKILSTQYPFASSKLMSDGGEIFWDYNENTLIKLDQSLQFSFKKIIEPFCKKLEFNDKTTLAQRYWPLGKERAIVVDPHHCFGQPSVAGTNINVDSISQLLQAGETIESISTMYNIRETEIKDVISFQHKIAA